MPPRIAIPLPHSFDAAYAERSIPQYERAVELAGATAVRVRLDQTPDEIKNVVASCDAVLLPGSKADVDPEKFKAARSPHTAETDARRDAADHLLLDDAYRSRKPVLGICYGLQSLNVYQHGSLVQHIPDFLPPGKRNEVNHEAGAKVAVAHTVAIEPASRLSEIVSPALPMSPSGVRPSTILPVNSSHHQSADAIGDGLRIVARCVEDGIVEALEGTAPDHFVVAVQWHPERSVDADAASRAIFQAFVNAASLSSR